MKLSPGLIEIVEKISNNARTRSILGRRTLYHIKCTNALHDFTFKMKRKKKNGDEPEELNRRRSREGEEWRIYAEKCERSEGISRRAKAISEREEQSGGAALAGEILPPFLRQVLHGYPDGLFWEIFEFGKLLFGPITLDILQSGNFAFSLFKKWIIIWI